MSVTRGKVAVSLGKPSRIPPAWPVDAHVHLYAPDNVPAALDAAFRHFSRYTSPKAKLGGALLLTQSAKERVFESLVNMQTVGPWTLEIAASEPSTILASNGVRTLAVCCGRQIRADDGLEVSLLGTLASLPDGQPFEEILDRACELEALVAIPWGFGKWFARRGQRVARALSSRTSHQIFLSDSGARPALGRELALINRARKEGTRILAGTDPFPFSRDTHRIGSFGFLAECQPDHARPFASLRRWLDSTTGTPALYGRRCSLSQFIVNQVGIRLEPGERRLGRT